MKGEPRRGASAGHTIILKYECAPRSLADAFNTYVDATNAKHDDDAGLLYLEAADYANLQSLYLVVGTGNAAPFELTPSAQTWPAALNGALGDSKKDRTYLAVQDIGVIAPVGFICGMVFMQRFYTVFDTAGKRIGLAPTSFTDAVE